MTDPNLSSESRAAFLAYAASMLEETARLARAHGVADLAYFLEMALEEAARQLQRTRPN